MSKDNRSYSGLFERFYQWLEGDYLPDWRNLKKQFSMWQQYGITYQQERILKMASPAYGVSVDEDLEKKGSFIYRKKEGKDKFVWRDKKGRFTKSPNRD